MQKIVSLSLVLLLSLLSLSSCSTETIVDKLITFDETRRQLSLDYMKTRYDLERVEPLIDPQMIVVHWTAIPSFEKSFEAFEPSILPNTRPDINQAGSLNVSAHFLIDRDGTIYRLLPETTMARHVIGLNHCAIGIENVGGTEETPLTAEQLKANITLVRTLKKKYPKIDYLIGHYEYTNFEGHPLWLEKDDGYRTEKTDPGIEFINEIRASTAKYNWKPVPQKSN